MWFSAIKLAVSAGSKIYANKQKTKMAMSDAQLMHASRMAEGKEAYQGKLLEARQSDWKDEAVLIILSLPIAILAWAVVSDDPAAMDKVKLFFEMFSELPKWFTNLWILVVASIYGIKGTQIFKNGGKKIMPNNRFNKQVTPKGYKAGGSVKKSEHPLAGRQGNLLHRLKSQKQIKAITDTKKYKDASYNKKQKMLDAGGAYTKSAPDQKSRTSRKMGGRIRRMGRGAQSSKKPIVIKSSPEIILLSAQKEGPAKRHTTIKQIPMNFKKGGEVKR